MKICNFRKYKELGLEGGVSIARSAPRWVKGYRCYRPLNPGTWFRSMPTVDAYVNRYFEEILDRLDAQKTYDEIVALAAPHEPILLCWEESDKFCHRQIVARWIEGVLGCTVPEVEP